MKKSFGKLNIVAWEKFTTNRVLTVTEGEEHDIAIWNTYWQDIADLAALIEHLELAPVWVAGQSFGGSITLRLAGERPDLLRGITAHEPPLFSLVADDPATVPMLEGLSKLITAVTERIASGDHAGAAEQYKGTESLHTLLSNRN